MKRWILCMVALALLVPVSLGAQDRHLEAILARHIYPPEIIMQHQRHLELTGDQEETIRAMTRDFQSTHLELQWELEDQSQAFAELMTADPIDIGAAMEQFEVVLQMEAQIKKSHVRLLMEIRSVLTPEQRERMSVIMEDLIRRGEGERKGEGDLRREGEHLSEEELLHREGEWRDTEHLDLEHGLLEDELLRHEREHGVDVHLSVEPEGRGHREAREVRRHIVVRGSML